MIWGLIPPAIGSPVGFKDNGGRQSLFGLMTYHCSAFWGDFSNSCHVQTRPSCEKMEVILAEGIQVWQKVLKDDTVTGMLKIRNSRSFSLGFSIVGCWGSKGATLKAHSSPAPSLPFLPFSLQGDEKTSSPTTLCLSATH